MSKQSPKTLERRKKHQLGNFEKTLTIQSEKDKCCINNILAQYRKTGLIDHIKQHDGRYEDVSTAGDFQEAMNTVSNAQQSFDQLPSEIRKQFDNNPAEFLNFVHDEKNHAALIKMGLANPPENPPQPSVDTPAEPTTEGSTSGETTASTDA